MTLSQTQYAKDLGVSRDTVNLLEAHAKVALDEVPGNKAEALAALWRNRNGVWRNNVRASGLTWKSERGQSRDIIAKTVKSGSGAREPMSG